MDISVKTPPISRCYSREYHDRNGKQKGKYFVLLKKMMTVVVCVMSNWCSFFVNILKRAQEVEEVKG